MNSLLVDPTVVLVVGGTVADRERVSEAVTDGDPTAVVGVADVHEAESELASRDDVGCVVAVDGDESTFTDLRESVREVNDFLPVVVFADVDESTVTAVARGEHCRFLPRSSGDAVLRDVVDDALASYDERRQTAADSSVLATLLEEGELTIFAKDREGRFLRMADVPYTLDPDEAQGKTDLEVFGGDDSERARMTHQDDLQVVETGEPIRDKVEEYASQGGSHYSQVTKIPWYDDDGDVRGLVGYAINVTERMQLREEVQEQHRLFDQFASYVSHDLRTPLQVSVGALELAREGDESALDRIERANERIEEIIDDLRALSKGDRSDVLLSEEVIDALDVGVEGTELAPLVESVWDVNGTDAAELVLDVPAGTQVVSEPGTLRPLIENLLKNAIEHVGPDVTVRVGTTERGFYVEDDGEGIPEDERENVLEDGYTTAEDGTGTGLAIVTRTVEQQDWELTITEGATGSGARIEITDVPVVTPPDVTPGAAVELSESVDVGDVSIPGEATYDPESETWTVVGNGRDIWHDIDEFHFTHGDARNPVRIEGRLSEFDGVEEYSKAGLMIRDGVDDDGAFAFVGSTGDHGTETMWRERRGVDAASDQLEEPYEIYQWYRVDAVGDRVTLFVSTDGTEWQALDQRRIDLDDSVAVGLVVCSHSEGETSEATFEDVTVTELDAE